MTLVEYAAVLGLLTGKTAAELADETGADRIALEQALTAPATMDVVVAIQGQVIESAAAKDYGVEAAAKALAPQMVQQLSAIALRGKSEAVKHKAAMDLLGLAGHVRARRIETLALDRLLNELTPGEEDAFLKSGQWPERLVGKAMQ
jgi:hypothetical protein